MGLTSAAKPLAVSSAALDAETPDSSPPFGYKKTALNHLGAVSKKFHSVQVFVLQNMHYSGANRLVHPTQTAKILLQYMDLDTLKHPITVRKFFVLSTIQEVVYLNPKLAPPSMFF